MGSRPKLQRLTNTLKALAADNLGEYAEPIDFIVLRVAQGQTVSSLAREVADAMGESASRSWLSWRFNHLVPDAKERIASARRARGVRTIASSGEASTGAMVPPWSGEPTAIRTAVQVESENDHTRRLRGSDPAHQ